MTSAASKVKTEFKLKFKTYVMTRRTIFARKSTFNSVSLSKIIDQDYVHTVEFFGDHL